MLNFYPTELPLLSLEEIEALLAISPDKVVPEYLESPGNSECSENLEPGERPQNVFSGSNDSAGSASMTVVRFECSGAKFVVKVENLPAVLASEAFRERLKDCEQVVFVRMTERDYQAMAGLDLA